MGEKDSKDICLNIDSRNLSDAEYKQLWNRIGKIEIKLVEKIGECKHNLGDTFVYDTPYKRPQNVCFALLHVLDLYTWRVALGFPFWDAGNREVYRIHCSDSTGTIWEMRRIK